MRLSTNAAGRSMVARAMAGENWIEAQITYTVNALLGNLPRDIFLEEVKVYIG